jgi:hypothetical protein
MQGLPAAGPAPTFIDSKTHTIGLMLAHTLQPSGQGEHLRTRLLLSH